MRRLPREVTAEKTRLGDEAGQSAAQATRSTVLWSDTREELTQRTHTAAMLVEIVSFSTGVSSLASPYSHEFLAKQCLLLILSVLPSLILLDIDTQTASSSNTLTSLPLMFRLSGGRFFKMAEAVLAAEAKLAYVLGITNNSPHAHAHVNFPLASRYLTRTRAPHSSNLWRVHG